MSDSADPSPRGCFFWSLAPLLVLFLVLMPFLVNRNPVAIIALLGMELFAGLLLLGLFNRVRFWWAWRAAAALLFMAYVSMLFVGGPFGLGAGRTMPSILTSVAGLILIGLPALVFALTGCLPGVGNPDARVLGVEDAEEVDLESELARVVRREVFAALRPLDEIVPMIMRVYSDDCDPETLRPLAEEALDAALLEYEAQQALWPAVTDCDRLDAACEWLEEEGIICRQDYLCCGTCGCAAIEEELREQRDGGREVVGYLFYHEQDTDAAVEGGGVYLNYGSVLRGDGPAVAIGHRIVQALESQGLVVTWNGSIAWRIHVDLDWKRRRHDAAPAVDVE